MRAALLLCLLPAVLAGSSDPVHQLVNQIEYFGKIMAEEVGNFDFLKMADSRIPDSSNAKANIVYGPVLVIIKEALANLPVLEIPSLETETLSVTNGVATGLNNTFIVLEAPNVGFDINNLTVYLPYLEVSAEEYTMNGFDLGIVILDGQGPLYISLTGLRLSTAMKIKRLNKVYVVKTISSMEFSLDDAKFELGNLGGSQAMSDLLNGIVNKILVKTVNSLNVGIQRILATTKGDCAAADLTELCSSISKLMTNLVNSIVHL